MATKAATKTEPEPNQENDQLLEQELEGSSRLSPTDSSGATSLAGDPGPEFDPDQAEADARERAGERQERTQIKAGGTTGIEIEWHEETVDGLYQAQGAVFHQFLGKTEDAFVWSKVERKAVVGPTTRILNRYDATRMAAATGDELALLMGLTGYLLRSTQENARVIKAQKQAEAEAKQATEQFGLIPTQQTQETTQ